MKKIVLMLCAVLVLASLTACGNSTPPASASQPGDGSTPPTSASQPEASVPPADSSTPASTPATGAEADYKTVIEDARPAELNDLALYDIVTGPTSSHYTDVFSEAFGFVEADMQRYAICLGLINTHAYGVAIILPAEGKQQAILDQVNAYVEMQRKAQENYLPDQYEIAMNAQVQTVATGEVLLAMCEDAATVMDGMLAGLAG